MADTSDESSGLLQSKKKSKKQSKQSSNQPKKLQDDADGQLPTLCPFVDSEFAKQIGASWLRAASAIREKKHQHKPCF